MSFQSSILGMLGTIAGAVKIGDILNKKTPVANTQPTTQAETKPADNTSNLEEQQQTANNTPTTQAKPEKPEPVFIGGQQVSEEVAAKVRAAVERREQAEAALVVAQTEKRAKRAEEDPYISSLTSGYSERVKEAKK